MTWLPAFIIGWLLGCAFMHVIDRVFLMPREREAAIRVMRSERAETVQSIADALDKD